GDRQLTDHPEKPDCRSRVVVATGLCQVATSYDAELLRQTLEQDGHQVRHQDYAEQGVSELRSALKVGGPVSGIHVAHGDHVARSSEGENLPPPMSAGNRNRPVDLGERWRYARPPPTGVCGREGGPRSSRFS